MPRVVRSAIGVSMAVFVLSSLPVKADIAPYGVNTTIDTTTGFVWLNLTQTENMSFLQVSAQLAPGGHFAAYRYATVDEVETLWADAGLTGPSLGCNPQSVCLAERVPLQAAQTFVGLMGNTWSPSYGLLGGIGLTSTPYTAPWPGCAPYTCYVTPEVRIYDDLTGRADVIVLEGLRDYIADPIYGSWLVDTSVRVETPEPSSLWLLGALLICLFGSVFIRSLREKHRLE